MGNKDVNWTHLTLFLMLPPFFSLHTAPIKININCMMYFMLLWYLVKHEWHKIDAAFWSILM